MLHDRQIQTVYPPQNNMGTETNMYKDRKIQTNEIRRVDLATGMTSSIMGTQTPQYRSQFAREIASIPMDTSENNGQVTLPPIAHQQPGIQQPSIRHALPAPALQQPLFIKPPSQQHALPQQPQQLALPQPPRYPIVPQPRGLAQAQPPQYPVVAQQLALPC